MTSTSCGRSVGWCPSWPECSTIPASASTGPATPSRRRVELHRATGSLPTNTLLLQDQDAVATALGFVDADALMAALADAGRLVTGQRRWLASLESWLSGPPRRAGGRDHPIEPGLVLRDGEADPPCRRSYRRRHVTRPAHWPAALSGARQAHGPARRWIPPLDRGRGAGGHMAARDVARLAPIVRCRPTRYRRHRVTRPAGHLVGGTCPSGHRSVTSRSATPITASPSIGTCSKPRPRPPP